MSASVLCGSGSICPFQIWPLAEASFADGAATEQTQAQDSRQWGDLQ